MHDQGQRRKHDETSRQHESLTISPFGVEVECKVEETSPLENVAEMHKVMCESKLPDKPNSCKIVLIQARITRDEIMLLSVRVMSVDVRQRR